MIRLRPDSSGNLCIQKNEGQLRIIPTDITGYVADPPDESEFDGWVYDYFSGDERHSDTVRAPRVSLSHSRTRVSREAA